MTSQFAALTAALLFSMAAVSAQAAVGTSRPTVAPASPAAIRAARNDHDPNQVVCKREEEIGTRLGGAKVCHTRAEWDNIAHEAGNAANDVQRDSKFSNPGGMSGH